MKTAEQNFLLLQEIEANRAFLLMAYQQNPALLKHADARIQQMFEARPDAGIVWANKPAHPASLPLSSIPNPASSKGVTLIELIIFIVIISTALAGIMLVSNTVSSHSADALIRKQSLAIAESLLEEVSLRYFTYCDPDDANASTATSAASCTGGAGGVNDESTLPLGPETAASVGGAETRYATPKFDNVSDYNGCQMNTGVVNAGCDATGTGGIKDIANNAIAGLSAYKASITVAPVALGNITLASNNALLISVTVTGPDGQAVVLDGYRTRYAPNLF